MKEIRTKLDIYVEISDEEAKNLDETKSVIFSKISDLLEEAGFSYQVYEQEMQEI
jgi:hypothetical protein